MKDIIVLSAALLALNFLGPTAVVLSVPFAFLHHRLRTPSRLLGTVLAFGIFAMIPEPPLVHYVNLYHFLAICVPTLVFIESHQRTYPPAVSITASIACLIGIVFVGWAAAPQILGTGLFDGMINSLSRMGLTLPENSRKMVQGMSGIMPGIVAVSEGLFLLLNLYLFQRITGENIRFRSYEMPFQVLPSFSLIGVLYLADVNGLLTLGTGRAWLSAALIAFGLFFFFQGLAVVVSFADRPVIPPFFRWITYLICFVNPGPILVAAVGIADLWFHFRRRLAIMPENDS